MEGSKDVEVYKAIVSYMEEDEFKNAKQTFFEANRKSFEEGEENKLEYTTIHEQYIHILDQLIETKMKGQFSEAEVESFYATFKDHQAEYEAIDSAAMESLLTFIDFEKFKQVMLSMKDMKDEVVDKAGFADLKKLTDPNIYNELIAENCDPKLGWKKVYETNDDKQGLSILIHQRPMEGKRFNMTKQVSEFRGVGFEELTQLGLHMEDMPMKNVLEFRVVEKDEAGFPKVMYSRSKGQGMMSDRELLFEQVNHVLPTGQHIQVKMSVEREDCPQKPNTIRMEMWELSTWTPKEDGSGLVWTQFQNMDFGGYIPPMLMNMVLGNAVSEQIKGMHSHLLLLKDKIKNEKK